MANIDVAHHHLAARGRRRPIEMHFDDSLARRFAKMHTRHDLLARIATLVEIDAMQPIEIGIMHESVAVRKIDTALGHAERRAMRFIGVLWCRREGKRLGWGDE